MGTHTYLHNLPGRHVAAILPPLVHRITAGEYEQCPAPATCTECAPRLAQRRAFYAATGDKRAELRAALDAAQRLDEQEATAWRQARPEPTPGAPF